jgi:hypothetical protein
MKLSGLKGETYCMLPQNIGLIILKYSVSKLHKLASSHKTCFGISNNLKDC